MDVSFTPNEARVIGCLMEKSVLTPDLYPMSLNALQNACNQKSSRDPVLALEAGVVQRTVNDLVARQLVMVQPYGGRVEKYQQRFCNTQFASIKLAPPEFAIVCLLLLRGAQTPGELKTRSERLHEFAEVAEVEAALESLLTRSDGPFVARLPREPRRRDHAYTHLFFGSIDSAPRTADVPAEPHSPSRPRDEDAFAALVARVERLEDAVAALRAAAAVTPTTKSEPR